MRQCMHCASFYAETTLPRTFCTLQSTVLAPHVASAKWPCGKQVTLAQEAMRY